METTIIYYLHKGDDIPFYIGKTINLKSRLKGHKKKFGKDIQLEEIDFVKTGDWKFWEKYWISQFKTWGFELVNKNDGGGGVNFCTLTHKNKISQAMMGNKSFLGKTHSSETKLKIGISMKGKQHKLGHINSKETREKISKSNIGKKISDETKAKISHALKGRELSEDHVNKIKAKRGYLQGRRNTWNLTPVLQLTMEGEFIKEWSSQIEAQNYFNKPNGDGIGACCRNKQKSAYGYKWKFKN